MLSGVRRGVVLSVSLGVFIAGLNALLTISPWLVYKYSHSHPFVLCLLLIPLCSSVDGEVLVCGRRCVLLQSFFVLPP